jgi:excisionase family DNA binding protein
VVEELMNKGLLTIKEAAAFLSVSERTLQELYMRGDIKSIKIGKRRLFPASVLQEYIDIQVEAQNPEPEIINGRRWTRSIH